MTDVNGVPIIGTGEQPAEVIKPAVTIAQVPVDLKRGQNIIEMQLKAPGIVRAAGFWLQTPAVIGVASGARAVEKIMQPLLFAECDPHAELVDRVFLFQPSDAAFVPREGWVAVWRATAIGEGGAMHVFEIMERPS
jgi:hypothetical protein